MNNEGFGENFSILTPTQIAQALTLEDVKNFLISLGVEQIEEDKVRGYLICPTICHNPLGSEASMKLYWYQNNHCFKCYTECNEAMSIFELYRRFMDLNYYSVTMNAAIEYVSNFLTDKITAALMPLEISHLEEEINKYQFHDATSQLPSYSSTVLDCFTSYHCNSWKKEGITDEVMNKFQIRFWPLHSTIIIPHYDIDNRLIGIRGRFLDPEEEQYGKYRPIQIGNCLYTFPLHNNLYAINFHKKGIKQRKAAIIVEGEKSTMLDDAYYSDYANAVACCGFNFSKYQISLLTDVLGANEIIVALDKEYKNTTDETAIGYRKHIEKLCFPHRYKANFSYIWDYNNLLQEKDSPYDKGKDIFEVLYKERIKLR